MPGGKGDKKKLVGRGNIDTKELGKINFTECWIEKIKIKSLGKILSRGEKVEKKCTREKYTDEKKRK